MRIEARLFEIITGFFVLAAIVYGTLTAIFEPGGLEWAGTTAMVLSAGLTLIIGTFFRFVARRLDTRPEDYEDADTESHRALLGPRRPHLATSNPAEPQSRNARGCLPRLRSRVG